MSRPDRDVDTSHIRAICFGNDNENSPLLVMQSIPRRRFVKMFTLGTAFSTLFGKPWRASVLADITPSMVGLLRIKLSDFPALLEDFSSVRLGINPIENIAGPLGPFYPILINHHFGTTYYALDTMCKHAGCIVPPFDESSGGIICGCHGSGYAIDGRVLNGPTVSPLTRYPITFDDVDTLTVEIPNLGYSVNSSLVQSASTPRLRLDFPTFEHAEYEVKFREHISDSWTVVPFALSLDGPSDELSLSGDGFPATAFVNRTTATGFYSVAIKVLDLTEGTGE
jgi:nitrite reductase/ring-hydroxylating ferredoxin subunit